MLLAFPGIYAFQLLIEPDVASVTGGADFSRRQGLQHAAAALFGVGTAHKAADVDVRGEVREGVRELFRVGELHILQIEGGKAGRVGPGPAFD